ncbi:MAG: DUF4160 domain-containing protein [Nitrospirae bacterium]|nr:DUF4160 domain-containing protein [Nitrospirota bacterium]
MTVENSIAQLVKPTQLERDDNIAKFRLNPVRLQSSGGFNRLEISKIHKIVNKNCSELLEAWHEYSGN